MGLRKSGRGLSENDWEIASGEDAPVGDEQHQPADERGAAGDLDGFDDVLEHGPPPVTGSTLQLAYHFLDGRIPQTCA